MFGEAAVEDILMKLEKLDYEFLKNEKERFEDLNKKFEESKLELARAHSLLKDADSYIKSGDQYVNDIVSNIVKDGFQLQDLILSIFANEAVRSRSSMIQKINLSTRAKQDLKHRGVISGIKNITTRISKLCDKLQHHGITTTVHQNHGNNTIYGDGRWSVFEKWPADTQIYGFHKVVEELVDELLEANQYRFTRVVSICGMGGCGKTTLAKNVFTHPRVRLHFKKFAWVNVSQQGEERGIWEEALYKMVEMVEEKKELKKLNHDHMARNLYHLLQSEKCLVAIDDICSIEVCDKLKVAFPNETRSKILITTRRRDIATYVDKYGFCMEPPPLNDVESWKLLQQAYAEQSVKGATYDSLIYFGKEMVKQCVGLPLAIMVLAKIIATFQTINEWVTLAQNVRTCINLKGVSSVLERSYEQLPYNLKQCFLYLANFPEHCEIPVKDLCKNWVAEGFVQMSEQEEVLGKNVEGVAYKHLRELFNRNLVQVGTWSSNGGKIKSCHLHVLMRDMALLKARDEKFLHFINFQNKSDPTNSFYIDKVRRFGMHLEKDAAVETITKLTKKGDVGIRSVVLFNSTECVSDNQAVNHTKRVSDDQAVNRTEGMSDYQAINLTEGVSNVQVVNHTGGVFDNLVVNKRIPFFKRLPLACCKCVVEDPILNEALIKKFSFLRILRLEDFGPDYCLKVPTGIQRLTLLALLSFKNSKVYSLPSSMVQLPYLETLDMKTDFKVQLNDPYKSLKVVSRMIQLRHLSLPKSHSFSNKKLRLANLFKLRTLVNVSSRYCDLDGLAKMTKLSKLCIVTLDPHSALSWEDVFNTARNVESFSLLGFFDLSSKQELIFSIGSKVRKLTIDRMSLSRLPFYMSTNLVKLQLVCPKLKEDPMPALGRLPSLQALRLEGAPLEKMFCRSDDFPDLRSLSIVDFRHLKEWQIGASAFGALQSLEIKYCCKLTFPSGFQHVEKLSIEKMQKRRSEEEEEEQM